MIGKRACLACLSALVCAATPVLAQLPDLDHAELHMPHEHTPLTIDDSLDWAELLQHAVVNYPRYIELAAREAEASALSARGKQWLAAQPSMSFSYLSDRQLDNMGLAEYQSSLSLPLWRPGQRRAAQQFGASASGESAAAAAALRLEVAGLLRESLWDIESAANEMALATEALQVDIELERAVLARHEAGELPLEDTLLARASVLERRESLVGAEASLVDAERAYERLTGLVTRPVEFAETQTPREDFDATHPLVLLADAGLERALAEAELIEKSSRGQALLQIGPRRQRDALSTFYTDGFSMQVTIPFGGRAHGAVQNAAAARRIAEAEALRAATLRELDGALHEALHTLENTEDALALATERSNLAMRHWSMGKTAFEAGEISVVDLLRREEAARAAVRDAARLAILRGRTIAEVNQAIGVLP